jgi:hypothetical protein
MWFINELIKSVIWIQLQKELPLIYSIGDYD